MEEATSEGNATREAAASRGMRVAPPVPALAPGDAEAPHAGGHGEGDATSTDDKMRSVVRIKEYSSGLLRDRDGVRRLVRMHPMYSTYRDDSRHLPGCASVPWPERSDAVCWYCRRHFSNVPVKIPRCRNIDGSLTVYGNFHCFACAVAWMWVRRTLTTPEQMALLVQLAEECGISGKLPKAPDLEDLEESGGDMTWEEFDRVCYSTAITVRVLLPPMVETMVGVEETYEAINAGGPGMEVVMEKVFGVLPAAGDRARELAERFEHTVASQDQIALVAPRRGRAPESSEVRPASAPKAGTPGAMKRRMMALMNEPATVALDRLKPPTREEIERRLQSQPEQHHGAQVSLYEQYVRQRVDEQRAQEERDAAKKAATAAARSRDKVGAADMATGAVSAGDAARGASGQESPVPSTGTSVSRKRKGERPRGGSLPGSRGGRKEARDATAEDGEGRDDTRRSRNSTSKRKRSSRRRGRSSSEDEDSDA